MPDVEPVPGWETESSKKEQEKKSDTARTATKNITDNEMLVLPTMGTIVVTKVVLFTLETTAAVVTMLATMGPETKKATTAAGSARRKTMVTVRRKIKGKKGRGSRRKQKRAKAKEK